MDPRQRTPPGARRPDTEPGDRARRGPTRAQWGDWLDVPVEAAVRYLHIDTVESLSHASWLEIEVVPVGG